MILNLMPNKYGVITFVGTLKLLQQHLIKSLVVSILSSQECAPWCGFKFSASFEIAILKAVVALYQLDLKRRC